MPAYKDKNGSWYFKCSIKGTQFIRRGYNTKSEALKAEAIFKIENQDKKINKKNLKFNELVELYLKHKKQLIKPTTYYGYTLKFKKYIIPVFENKEISKLSIIDFNCFRSNLSKSNLSDKNHIIKCLCDMFDYLLIYHDINIPYAKRIQPFKNYSPLLIKDDVNKPVDKDLFVNYYKNSNNYFKFYLLTTYIFGLRISELRGLHVNTFDLNKSILYINKVTTSKVGKNKSIDLIPKSSSSVRKYYLTESYKKMLEDYIKTFKLKPLDRLFFSSYTKKVPISETSIRRYLNSIEKENNLEHITPHGLRHGIASYLYAEGISFDDIGKYLGHKFGNVTMDTYIDLTKEKQQKILNIINKLIQEIV